MGLPPKCHLEFLSERQSILTLVYLKTAEKRADHGLGLLKIEVSANSRQWGGVAGQRGGGAEGRC